MKLTEGLKQDDLHDVVSNRLHVDEYKSKMGRDEDIVVLSFKTLSKEPGLDLADFFEKGYDYVLDADVSSGEIGDGDYLVFVELERNPKVIKQILELTKDLENLTNVKQEEMKFRYGKSIKKHDLTAEELEAYIPTSPEEYASQFPNTDDVDSMKNMAGIPVESRAPRNEFTDSWRVLGGIK